MTEDLFPAHKASLHLTHNDHKSVYETAAQWAANNDVYEHYEWVSDEQREKALATDSVWTLQWYPATPVGFYAVCGADLEAVLTRANEIDAESMGSAFTHS